MKIASAQKRKRARIEVIPLIDIMFFLLATFVLVSVSMTENRGLLVSLPESKSNESRDHTTTSGSELLQVTISILQDGTYALNKKELPFEELKIQLQELAKSDADRKFITIMGDKSSDLQSTIKILDLAKELRFSSITIRTRTAK